MELSDVVFQGSVDDLHRREFLQGFGAIAALGISNPTKIFSFFDRSKPIPSVPAYQNVAFSVDAFLEGKDISKEVIIADDIINVRLDIDSPIKKQNLKVRYYMLNGEDKSAIDKGDYAAISKNLVFLGGRDDLSTDTKGKGVLEGFFQYAPDLKDAYVPQSAFINPYDGKKYKSDQFFFLVQVFDSNDKLVASKWWSRNNKAVPMKFQVPLEERVEAPVEKKPKAPGKPRIFIYKQSLSRRRYDKELAPVMDVFQPHLYEFVYKESEVVLKKKVKDKTMEDIRQKARKYGYQVLPMISSFKENLIKSLLKSPGEYATMIKKEVDKQGWDGIIIDLESVRLRSTDATDLVKFMISLRQAIPKGKYKVGIAASPRFEGSEKDYPHHTFYDFRGLFRAVDYLQIMAYDFHNKRKSPSPILPEDKIDSVVNYAKKNADDPSKIVFLMPLYGYVWSRGGRGIGAIASAGNDRYLRVPGSSSRIVNGELRIETPSKVVYTQNGEVFAKRHFALDKLGVQNRGYWKQELAHPDIITTVLKM